jgi:hypothetical protein
MFWFSLQLLSETSFFLSRIQWDMIKKCVLVFMQSTSHSCQIYNKTSSFLDIFSGNTQISNFIKIRPVGAELFHADGRTDMTKLVVFCVVITEEYNVMVNRQELIGTTVYLTLQTGCRINPSTRSPFVTLLSRHAQSGRWSSFGKRCGSPNHI